MVICCNNTDILVILLEHVLSFTGHVWMDVGHNYNTWQYIDATTLAEHFGLTIGHTQFSHFYRFLLHISLF